MLSNGDLKNKMMELWQNTFHDSSTYISLVFDAYFDPKLVEYECDGNQLVSALMGVPYEFGTPEHKMKGLYLCGLATHPQYRSHGIMTRLLNSINEKAREAGYAFTFLLPADEGLRKYYRDRDYVNAFYRVTDNYTSLHNFDREFEAVLMEQKEKVSALKKKAYEALTSGCISKHAPDSEAEAGVSALIKSVESQQSDLQIIHSDKDINVLIRENILSNGSIYYVKNNRGEITAAGFTFMPERSVVDVVKLFAVDEGSKFKLLSAIKKGNPDASMTVKVPSVEMDSKAIWNRVYSFYSGSTPQSEAMASADRVYSLAAHAKVYGMAKILNLHEILKFQASLRHDLKYSILVKDGNSDDVQCFRTQNGRVELSKVHAGELDKAQSLSVMSSRDVAEILFRRRDTDNLITEAFGIPAINSAACLLLE